MSDWSNTKVSVITVVFNGAKSIERTIQSVLSQDWPQVEYTIVDGASTDGTISIVKGYEPQLAGWISEPDRGMYHAINKGIARSTGSLIGIINSDDFYVPGALRKAVEVFAEEPGTDVVHGMIERLDPSGNGIGVEGNDSTFLDKGMIAHPACFITRSAYERMGAYREDMRCAADYELMLRFRKLGAKFHYIPEVFAAFSPGGISGSWRGAKETLDVQRQYGLISPVKQHLLKAYWRWRTLG